MLETFSWSSSDVRKVLVANRGEIAVRVMRACRELGIASVAVYSEADADALFVRYADESFCIGPPPASRSYLDTARLIEVALACGAEAIHPGYGFLAENPAFAKACSEAGIAFVGPSAAVLELMGNKIDARREMSRVGVPVVPGNDRPCGDFELTRAAAVHLGFPVIVKPSGGGGGIGMSVVRNEDELKDALESSTAIAGKAFGLTDVYLEKYIERPRHIEIQIIGDMFGNVVHLGERECSIQRRHQKLIEEAPSPALTSELRAEMGDVAVKAARSLGYQGAGTIEFIYSGGEFYFLEMNTRVQVEHPVTEMVTGIDIVKEQLRISAGERLGFQQHDVHMNGWAIECRINAEDVLDGFAPAPGRLTGYHAPGGIGVRVDSGVYGGYAIPPFYDSLIAKLVTWGRDRDEAIARMERALFEYVLAGTANNLTFHRAVMRSARFRGGEIDTHFVEEETGLLDEVRRLNEDDHSLGKRFSRSAVPKSRVAAIAAAAVVANLMNTAGGRI